MPLDPNDTPDLGASPTVSDVIAKHIRGAIAAGQLDEGEPIRQDEVAALFNVSKIPVREALKRLEAEGLVAFQRNRGAIVTSLSEPEIAQIFEARAILESSVIRMAVPNMTAATIARAVQLCDQFSGETDVSRWSDWNWQLHSCLYEDAGRPFLANLIRSCNDRVERYLRVQLALSDGIATADREHREIVEACRRGDADKAASLVHDHIQMACKSLLRHLPKKRG